MSALELEEVTKAWPPLSRPVRVPHSETEYRELVELLDHLTDQVGQNEDHPLASLMDVIGVLVERYEAEHVPQLNRVVCLARSSECATKIILEADDRQHSTSFASTAL